MNPPVPTDPPKFKLGGMFRFGLILFLVGSGPLLLTMLCAKIGLTKDPNPNPVLFGIMAMFTFWPSLVCMIGGACDSFLRYRKAKKLLAAAH